MLPGPRTRAALATGLLPVALLLGACGDDGGGAPGAAVSTAPNGDVVSSVDVAFAQELLPHHADALVLVDLTLGRALDPRVADLVERLRAEHTAQVQTLSGWLTAWGEEVPETARDHAHAHATDGTGDGRDELTALEQARGAAFERALLAALVEHHTEGVAMAEAEVADGRFGPTRDLAADVVDTQGRDLDEMVALLEQGTGRGPQGR